MKFKWKYVAWILPVIIMYAGAYALYERTDLNWWGFPITMSFGVGFIASIILNVHLIMEDK